MPPCVPAEDLDFRIMELYGLKLEEAKSELI